VARPRRRLLHCIVLRENGVLRLVWPLVSYRRLLWNYLVPLSPDAADHTSILVADGPDAARLIELAWRAARTRCRADFIHLEYMYEGSEIHRIALREPRILGRSRHESWVALLRGEPDWTTLCRAVGTMHGKKPGQLERRLAKEGTLEVRVLEASETECIANCVQAMLSWKREWSKRVSEPGKWLFSPYYERFLIAALTHRDERAHALPIMRLIAVTLDDTPVAVAIMSYGNPVANAVIAGFDPEYGRFGAGTIAWEHAVRWAFEHRYDIDFGVGSERFKTYWSRAHGGHAWTMQIASTAWGAIGHRIWRALRDARAGAKGTHANAQPDASAEPMRKSAGRHH
jgi:CelD/BcsL family acetyltransferase involved in cellulose biosynthesis